MDGSDSITSSFLSGNHANRGDETMYNSFDTFEQVGPARSLIPVASLTTEQAAQYLGLSASTLNKWRCYGTGPKFLKLGRAVRYLKPELDAFLEAREAVNTIY